MIAIHIVTFYLRCMVSEIMRFYCKPDMTSSWFRRQPSHHAIFHDGFWKSDNDFLIVFHSNFLSGMHGLRDNEVLLQAGYDVIVISPPGALQAFFHDGFWKSDHDFLIAFHSKCLPGMHGYRDAIWLKGIVVNKGHQTRTAWPKRSTSCWLNTLD